MSRLAVFYKNASSSISSLLEKCIKCICSFGFLLEKIITCQLHCTRSPPSTSTWKSKHQKFKIICICRILEAFPRNNNLINIVIYYSDTYFVNCKSDDGLVLENMFPRKSCRFRHKLHFLPVFSQIKSKRFVKTIIEYHQTV